MPGLNCPWGQRVHKVNDCPVSFTDDYLPTTQLFNPVLQETLLTNHISQFKIRINLEQLKSQEDSQEESNDQHCQL